MSARKKKPRVKVRRSWGVLNPRTRILDSKKRYNRRRAKREIHNEISQLWP